MTATALQHDFSTAQKISFGKPVRENGFFLPSCPSCSSWLQAFQAFRATSPCTNKQAKKARRYGRALPEPPVLNRKSRGVTTRRLRPRGHPDGRPVRRTPSAPCRRHGNRT